MNAARYAEIEALLARVRANERAAPVAEAVLADVRRFLHAEARLLDRRQYARWAELFTDDFAYWVPSTASESSLVTQVAVNFDDRRRMLDRIAYTTSGVQAASTPPSRTVRTLANIEAWEGANGAIEVTASLVIHEYRRAPMNVFAGIQSIEIAGGRIRTKIIELLDCDAPQGNNSFIL